MKGFTPGLFDRLMDVPVRGATSATGSEGAINSLNFSITALLFDAHLQPSTLHNSISKARHAASAGA
jgi:hypothetical protein